MRFPRPLLLAALALFGAASIHAQTSAPTPIRVAIVGLTHGHIKGFLHSLPDSTSAKLVAIVVSFTATWMLRNKVVFRGPGPAA